MDATTLFLLVTAGLVGGYIAGLIGLGGGIVFAPVLFFFFQHIGVEPAVLAPLTIGTSLLCTLMATSASAWFQYRRGAVVPRFAVGTGLFSAVAILLMTWFVTTSAWYDGTTFQIVFSVLLLVVVVRMVGGRKTPSDDAPGSPPVRAGWPVLAGTGLSAGVVAAAAGVGGGIVLVPAYNQALRLTMHQAVGTSSATIVLIALAGVVTYALSGLGAAVPPTAFGYVDAGHALLLAVPAMLTARAGVWTAHRIRTRALRLSFAAIAAVVAVRLFYDALA